MSFPRNVGQVPVYYNFKNTGRPSTSIDQVTNSGYADVENSPLYSFGYGLSYTNFSYSDLKISSDSMTKNSKINASVTVSNTGRFKGEEGTGPSDPQQARQHCAQSGRGGVGCLRYLAERYRVVGRQYPVLRIEGLC